MKIFACLLLLSALVRQGKGLSGYDCDSAAPNITTVSLLEVKECEVGGVEPDVEETRFQLLQKIEHAHVKVTGCRIKETIRIKRCGFMSHVSEVNKGHYTRTVPMTKDVCEDIIRFGEFRFKDIKIDGIARNTTTYQTITLVGSKDDEGSCDGGHYSLNGVDYEKALVESDLEISAHEYYGLVNLDKGMITAAGIGCDYAYGKCVGEDGLYLYWEPIPEAACSFDRYSILYEGPGAKITDNTTLPVKIVYFTNSSNSAQFGLARGHQMNLCGYPLWTTEHPKFFILEVGQGQGFTKKYSLDAQDVLQEAYYNTKITYLARHVKTQFHTLYKDILAHRCGLQRQILTNALVEIRSRPDVFASMVMGKPGYMAFQTGEVAHVFQCKELTCKVRETDYCYDDLPVDCQGRAGFLRDRTRVIVDVSAGKECSSMLASSFKIGSSWYQLTPSATRIPEPDTLDPRERPTWKYSDIDNFMNAGIYSTKSMEDFREQVQLSAEHQAHMQLISRKLKNPGYSTDNDRLQNLIDRATIESAIDGFINRTWGKFTQFGLVCAGFLGIYVIVMAVKWVIDTIVRGYGLHTLFGCGTEIFAAVLGSVTHCLTATKVMPKDQNQGNRDNYRPEDIEAQIYQPMNRVPRQPTPPPTPAPRRCRSIEELEAILERNLQRH